VTTLGEACLGQEPTRTLVNPFGLSLNKSTLRNGSGLTHSDSQLTDHNHGYGIDSTVGACFPEAATHIRELKVKGNEKQESW
jgi:hypothetical protein